MIGQIIKQVSNDYTVLKDGKTYICKARGKFRNMKVIPLVGDFVKFDINQLYITEILPRKNELLRPSIANIDLAVIITSVKSPDFSTTLLDKLLVMIEYHNIKPIIIFTKIDLLNQEENIQIESYITYYKKIGYTCYINTEIEKIKKIFKGKVSVFTGQSGAGKSTLLNRLDKDLSLKTNEISKALGRGKHTTRHTELLLMLEGMIADTPGFSSLDLRGMTKLEIRDHFIDFNMYRDHCKYKDCLHDRETECIIKEKVNSKDILQSRYNNYIKFINELDITKMR